MNRERWKSCKEKDSALVYVEIPEGEREERRGWATLPWPRL